eukprot:TRINITY_DN61389_c0_g1_i1.p1 TRINITY_DN61389_c0_g1~~TRINITY_DN61389_c0_g1_i1.p1  ORF type:complete len:268 (-),score=35.35 TRINITY_DN61389_c0_g1_i1:255-1058(-)
MGTNDHDALLLLSLGGARAQTLQFLVCIGLLACKKFLEPSRLWVEFTLDVSKQMIGTQWIYCMNLFGTGTLGSFYENQHHVDWYWIAVVADCTLGVFLDYLVLCVLTYLILQLLSVNHVEETDFVCGEYRNPVDGRLRLQRYVKQLMLWLVTISIAKICLVMIIGIVPDLCKRLANFVLSPIRGSKETYHIAVAYVTPTCMHAFRWSVVDALLRKKGASRDVFLYSSVSVRQPVDVEHGGAPREMLTRRVDAQGAPRAFGSLLRVHA